MSDEMTTLLDRATPSAVDALDYEDLARRGRRRRWGKRLTGGLAGVVGVAALIGVTSSVLPTDSPPDVTVEAPAGSTFGPADVWDGRLTTPPLASAPENFERYVHPDEWAAVIQDCAAEGGVTMAATPDGDLTSYATDGDRSNHEVVIQDCRTRFPVADGVPAPAEAATIVEPVEPVGDRIIGLSAPTVPQPDIDRWTVSQDWATAMIDCLADSGIEATGGGEAVRMEGQQGGEAALDACQDGLGLVVYGETSTLPAGDWGRDTVLGGVTACLQDAGFEAELQLGVPLIVVPPVDEDGAELQRTVEGCAQPSDG